jgi:uncharacterized protein YcbX
VPVKGMRLVQPESLDIGADGIDGDRRFQVCRAGTLKSLGAKDPRLGLFESSWDRGSERLGIRFPSGRVAEAKVELGEPTTVTRAWDDADMPAREVSGPWAEALSDELGEDLVLVRSEIPKGGANDVAPLTFLSRASVQRLAKELEVEALEPDRFRMTLIADGPGEHQEDEWYGRELDVGDARIRIMGPVPRCAVTTRTPGQAEQDLDVLRTLIRYRGAIWSPYEDEETEAPFGVYAETVTPGPVRVGDEIALLPAE